jgi:hypothetical protein
LNSCSAASGGVVLSAGTSPPSVPLGVFRNNYVTTFDCAGKALSPVFREASTLTDPRIFENNYVYGGGASGLYQDDTGLLTSIAQVNALTDATIAGNVGNGSRIGMGTSTGAPLWDFLGNPRPLPPSIGDRE